MKEKIYDMLLGIRFVIVATIMIYIMMILKIIMWCIGLDKYWLKLMDIIAEQKIFNFDN